MQLKSISTDPKAIILKVVENHETDQAADLVESKITAKEEPLPEFTEAFAALPKVFCEIMELPAKWATGLVIDKLTISRTKHQTRSVILSGTKQLECRTDFRHPVASPMIQVDKAADGESGQVPLPKGMVDAVLEAIHHAEEYMNGKRSQTLLDFDSAKAGLQAVADLGQLDLEGTGN